MQSADETASRRPKLSAFVIAYNRAPIIGTCLRALAFADELIVIDKGSSDGTLQIATELADRVISVPWTPTVEETRAFAVSQCTHDWIMFTDDDECLSPEAVRFIHAELAAPRADIYKLAQRHYIMGLHDERAYYWPEYQMRLYRRGTVRHIDTVHGGDEYLSDSICLVPPDDGACMHHMSHRDVAQYIEKTNRYTSRTDRRRSRQVGTGIADFAHERIDHWQGLTDACEPDSYPAAVAVLRAVYDMIDRLKTWEEEAALDGAQLLHAICARLDAAYVAELSGLAKPRAGAVATAVVAAGPAEAPMAAAAADTAALSRAVMALREGIKTLREAMGQTRGDLAAANADTAAARADAQTAHARVQSLEATMGEFARRHEAMFAEMTADIGAREADRVAREAYRVTREAEHAAMRTSMCQAVSDATARAQAAEHLVRELETSTSWRITAPIRALLNQLTRR